MKTATVRDLRNTFASLTRWIEQGEEIAITRKGKNFATLSPVKLKKAPKIDWAARFAKREPLGRPSTRKETDEF